jgi:threonine/homoserine/homoserine lactone efflux protein
VWAYIPCGTLLLIVVGFIAKFWWLILLVLAAIGAGLLLWLGHQRKLDASDRRRREQASLAARADRQHALILAGDDRGVYGDYPPAVA